MSVSKKTVKIVFEKSKGYCECGCGKHFIMDGKYQEGFGPELHHRFWKSQYRKDDRDGDWNLSLLNAECHKKIHNGQARELDKKLKEKADLEKPIEQRSKKKIRQHSLYKKPTFKYDKKKMQEYRRTEVEYFKEHNDGLSPSQYKYNQQKLYIQQTKYVHKKK